MSMIKVSNLTKRYGPTTALDNLSFTVEKGEIVGFLGPNGAGKTTTMRILSCFIPATGGQVEVAGHDVVTESAEVRKRIGYLPENVPLYKDMRVIEYLTFRAKLKGLFGRRLRTRVEEVLFRCGLGDVRRKVIGHLSKGYRQRVGLADALVHEPELLILDEPTIGLDPNQIRHIRYLIRSLAQRHTVLLCSHMLPEVEMICERVLIINKGQIVVSDTPEKLVGLLRGNPCVAMEVRGDSTAIMDKLKTVEGVLKVTCEGLGDWHRFTCECGKGTELRTDLIKLMADHGWDLREIGRVKRNLEDVFVEMTGT